MPAEGDVQSSLTVVFGGWAHCARDPITAVAIFARSLPRGPLAVTRLHERTDVSASLSLAPQSRTGFRTNLCLIGLQPRDEFVVVAFTEAQFAAFSEEPAFHRGHFSELAVIELEIELEPECVVASGISPVFVTSHGRSGSSALVRTMLVSPKVAAVDEPPWEARLLSYFLTLTRMAVSPANGLSRGENEKFTDIYTSTINNPFLSEFDYPKLYAESSANSLSIARDIATGLLTSTLSRVGGALNGSASGRMFVEKSSPGSCVPNFARALWPATKEIYLTRKAEDWLLSGLRFSRQTDRYFGPELLGDLDELSDEIQSQMDAGLSYYSRHRDAMLHIRYEDLILRPAKSMGRVAEYLQVPMPKRLARLERDHATSPSPAADVTHAALLATFPRIAEYFAEWNETFCHSEVA
jgi:Sulfotransferase family